MVKLLVCDVDGTLLPYGEDAVLGSVLKLLSDIQSKNISVAIASGRSYQNLKALFGEISDRMYFICHDGALCMRSDKMLYHKPVSYQSAIEFLKFYGKKYSNAVLYGVNNCYVFSDNNASGENIIKVNNFFNIKEQIYKLAVYEDCTDIEEMNVLPYDLRLCRKQRGCIEYVSGFADKSFALTNLQSRLFITGSDTAAIGNDVNDIKMLKNVKYSAAIADSKDEVLNAAEFKVNNAAEFLKLIAEMKL